MIMLMVLLIIEIKNVSTVRRIECHSIIKILIYVLRKNIWNLRVVLLHLMNSVYSINLIRINSMSVRNVNILMFWMKESVLRAVLLIRHYINSIYYHIIVMEIELMKALLLIRSMFVEN